MSNRIIERSSIGIEKSGTGIKQSYIELKWTVAVPVLLTVLLLWASAAVAIQNEGTGTASEEAEEVLVSELEINNDLVTINLRDGYKVIAGYGYSEGGYSEISLYSLEYVHVLGTGGENLSETAPIQNEGTGSENDGQSNNQQLKAWGIAEVVLSERGIADLIVYQFNGEGTLEEVGVYSGVEVH